MHFGSRFELALRSDETDAVDDAALSTGFESSPSFASSRAALSDADVSPPRASSVTHSAAEFLDAEAPPNSGTEASTNKASGHSQHSHGHGHGHGSDSADHDHFALEGGASASAVVAYVLVLALSFHSVFEGIAFGTQRDLPSAVGTSLDGFELTLMGDESRSICVLLALHSSLSCNCSAHSFGWICTWHISGEGSISIGDADRLHRSICCNCAVRDDAWSESAPSFRLPLNADEASNFGV